jgi:hypothetical protein
MAQAGWWSWILVALLAFEMADAPRAAASDEDIPTLRTKDNVLIFTHMMLPTLDAIPPPISSIPFNQPFKAIGLEVRFGNEEALAEFARHVMDVRLEELGIAEQIHVIHPPFPGGEGRVPADVSTCEVLRVTFVFNITEQKVEGRGVSIIAADMLATQQASEQHQGGEIKCSGQTPRPYWALQVGPHALAMPTSDDQGVLERSKKLIRYFIDNQIVPKVLQSNKTAMETFRSWLIEFLK